MDFFNSLMEKKNLMLIISLILNIILLFSCGFLIWKVTLTDSNEVEEFAINLESNEVDVETTNEPFYVEVKGAVKTPGVYTATSENIINDIITLAGGFTKSAYTKNINLSKKVRSELVIYVYTKSEYEKLTKEEEPEVEVIIEPCVCPEYDITDCTNSGISEIIPDKDDTNSNTSSNNDTNNNVSNNDNNTSIDSEKEDNNNDDEVKEENNLININTASKEELMTLSGVGASKADKIIEYRTTNGKFKTIEDIKNVSGIGDAAFEKIKDNITV